MDDLNYYQAFGLDEPKEPAVAESGAEEEAAETAETVEEPAEEPAEEQEQAEEAEEEAPEPKDGEPAVEAPQKRKQTKKENAEFAAARRRAERDAAIERARMEERQKAQAEMDALITGANIENPYTGERVRTKADWDAWQQRHRDEQRKAMQARAGMTDEDMASFIDQLPEVQQARAAEEQANEVLRRAQREHAQAAIENELAKIREYDPNVQTLDDIEKTAENPQILDKVRAGYALSDAWLLTHFSEVVKQQAAAARQAATTAARGKEHLRATHSRGGTGMEPVPADVREQYRILNPGVSDEEIAKDYNRYLNK